MLEQRGELVVQFESYLGDLGRVKAAEPGARLVEGEPRGMVGVFHNGRTQRGVEQNGRVVAVHFLGNGVITHEVLDTAASVSGQTH